MMIEFGFGVLGSGSFVCPMKTKTLGEGGKGVEWEREMEREMERERDGDE